jgi:hypothetical protein
MSLPRHKATWSLTLREEYRLRVFALRRDEMTGDWRKLQNEEIHNLKLFTKYN